MKEELINPSFLSSQVGSRTQSRCHQSNRLHSFDSMAICMCPLGMRSMVCIRNSVLEGEYLYCCVFTCVDVYLDLWIHTCSTCTSVCFVCFPCFCVYVRACVRVCVCACVRVCLCVYRYRKRRYLAIIKYTHTSDQHTFFRLLGISI